MLGYKTRPGELDRVFLQQNQKKIYQCPLKNHVRFITGSHNLWWSSLFSKDNIFKCVLFFQLDWTLVRTQLLFSLEHFPVYSWAKLSTLFFWMKHPRYPWCVQIPSCCNNWLPVWLLGKPLNMIIILMYVLMFLLFGIKPKYCLQSRNTFKAITLQSMLLSHICSLHYVEGQNK